MTILYPPAISVKATDRTFGQSITVRVEAIPLLPRTAIRRPFEPTPEDRAWWAAESDRIARERETDRLADEMFAERFGPEAVFEPQEYRGSMVGHPA